MTDYISRADAIEAVAQEWLSEASAESPYVNDDDIGEYRKLAKELFEDLPSADAEWIPCSEKLPSDDEIVNITWVNHNPPPYYAEIAEKSFVASGLRYRDKWYWYSSVCQDLHQDFDLIDKDIEVIAWQPLPKPYKGGDTE